MSDGTAGARMDRRTGAIAGASLPRRNGKHHTGEVGPQSIIVAFSHNQSVGLPS